LRTRIDFINWQPDNDEFGTKGLSQADNVIHEPEGYKPVHLASAGSFSTTGGLAASAGTILSIVTKPVGSQNDTFSAWVAQATTPTLHVGINGVTASAATTGYPLSFTTTGAPYIYAFDVCEAHGKIFFVVEARQSEASPSTTTAIRHIGYMDF
jgi:hypothetical protein